MEIKELLTTCNYWPGDGNGNAKINKYIVIHYVGAVSTAENNAVYFHDTYRGASANYFVDDNEIYRVVRDEDSAWHCGTTGAYKHPYCRNTNSIGIEMCCYWNNEGQLDISDSVVSRTIELTKELMSKYGIPADNVIRHFDVTGKNCPAPFVSNPSRWNDFKARIGDNTQPTTECDQILSIGSVVVINKILTVTGVSAENNLISIEELTGQPDAWYHWFDPTPFDVVDDNGNKTENQVCYVGCKVKLNGEYTVQDLVKTEDWACQLRIGNRINWVWTEPCYEIRD